MVPLPFRTQADSLEGVCASKRLDDVSGGWDDWMRIRDVPDVASELEHRPPIPSPLDWGQNGHPPARVCIRKSHIVPVAVLSLNDAALVWRATSRYRADHVQGELLHLVWAEW